MVRRNDAMKTNLGLKVVIPVFSQKKNTGSQGQATDMVAAPASNSSSSRFRYRWQSRTGMMDGLSSVRLCLVLALSAIMVHQTALHHRYASSSGGRGSLPDELESQFHAPPALVVADGAPGESLIPKASTNATQQTATRLVPAPDQYAKLVYFYGTIYHKLYEPVMRAFHSRGWSITRDVERAHVLWFDQPDELEQYYESVKPWQRINQLPNTSLWDDKDGMAEHINDYYAANQKEPLHSFPESYVLNNPNDLIRFQERLSRGGGLDIPWVFKVATVNQGEVGL